MNFEEPPPSEEFLRLATAPERELGGLMATGSAPERGALAGFEYRGLITAGWGRAAGVDRFVKGFVEGRGYNRRIPRGPRTGPWLPTSGPEPRPFAFFKVAPVDPFSVDNRYPKALLLDYGAFASGPLDPVGRIRDYLVTLDDDHRLLLGHAFVAVGSLRPPFTFFVLERLRPAPVSPER